MTQGETMADEPYAKVGLDQIYSTLTGVEKKLERIEERLDVVKDHEQRIRALEKKAWILALAAAVTGTAGGYILPLIGA